MSRSSSGRGMPWGNGSAATMNEAGHRMRYTHSHRIYRGDEVEELVRLAPNSFVHWWDWLLLRRDNLPAPHPVMRCGMGSQF